jgi:hypothetical protein
MSSACLVMSSANNAIDINYFPCNATFFLGRGKGNLILL